MDVELIKQTFDGEIGYKINKVDWCCDALKTNPVIGIYDEYDTPAVMIRSTERITSYEDSWDDDTYFTIKFCPFCGKPVNVTVIREEDVSEEFEKLKKQRHEAWQKAQKTDSKKEYCKLREMVRELDKKINWFYELREK